MLNGVFVEEMQCGRIQALPREVAFGIFIKLSKSINAVSTNSCDKMAGKYLGYED